MPEKGLRFIFRCPQCDEFTAQGLDDALDDGHPFCSGKDCSHVLSMPLDSVFMDGVQLRLKETNNA